MNPRWPIRVPRFILVAAAMFVALAGVAQAQWTEPDPGVVPPGGPTAAPLNTSGIAQTKEGGLRIENNLFAEGGSGLATNDPLNVNGNLRVTPDGGGQICLNGVCRSVLGEDFSNYLHLSPAEPDQGFVWLGDPDLSEEGYLRITSAGRIGLLGQAGQPTNRNTHGLFGVAGTPAGPSAPLTAGLFGQASVDDDYSIGIGGTTSDLNWANAYAAYFKGRVEIVGCLRWNGGDCLAAWPAAIPPGDYVRLLEDGDPAQMGNVHLNPASASVFSSLVLGNDPTGLDTEITCGDGICNNGETAQTCEADCFAIKALTATEITDGSARLTWDTLIPATSIVRYGLTDALGSEVVDESYVASHSVVLSSLNQDAVYSYEVSSVSESGSVRVSSIQTFRTLLDQTAPSAPTNLHTTTPAPDRVPLAWFHTFEDNPGGVGFSRFRIYRDDVGLLDETTNPYYEDVVVDQDATYAYRITALDLRGNESLASNELVVHVPTACTDSGDCTNPQYPLCCGATGCKASCGGGGSPVVLKTQYEQYQSPDEWENGGGWY